MAFGAVGVVQPIAPFLLSLTVAVWATTQVLRQLALGALFGRIVAEQCPRGVDVGDEYVDPSAA